ncbi:MAG TPA: helix-turn-helix transcriptional regulator, partial [Spongiibacteraceae bacterium]|nr:helix-turn-helix transcriptional regulator [Spongiibacteraceae bacterium]
AELPGLEAVAHLLNQSVSTLRRNLLREDTSFQAVMDRLRMQRSKELLAETELTIDDIADILGFSAPSVFSRAFKGWTGYPPSKYRLTIAMEAGGGASSRQ